LRPIIQKILKITDKLRGYAEKYRDVITETRKDLIRINEFIDKYEEYILLIPVVGVRLFALLKSISKNIEKFIDILDSQIEVTENITDFIDYINKYLKVS